MEFLIKLYNRVINMSSNIRIPWSKIKEAVKISWVKIFFSAFGRFFPILIGGIYLNFSKENFDFYSMLNTNVLIIFSATFIISSFYLWKKSTENSSGVLGLIFHVLMILLITILFILSYSEKIHNEEKYDCLITWTFWVSILFYIFYEVFFEYKRLYLKPEDESQKDYDALLKKFNEANK